MAFSPARKLVGRPEAANPELYDYILDRGTGIARKHL